jgi:hypothetical protein
LGLTHHTKSKGDLGVAKAFADLVEQGHLVLFPTTEHAPFDLVAYDAGSFVRVQVKYRAARRGVVRVELASNWTDRHGTHRAPMDKSEVDILCVYCPDTDECYYVRPDAYVATITLRITPTANGQRIGVWPAEQFRRLVPSLRLAG